MVTELITLIGAGIIGIVGAYISKDSPGKKATTIAAYGECLTQTKNGNLCQSILDAGEIKKKEVEE